MKKRDISEWASVAEIVGTVAVVISLALVVASIRQNTAVIQASNESFQYDLQDRWLADLLHNPELIEYWDKLVNDEPLTTSERGQVITMIQRSLNLWENAYVNYRAGLLSDEQWFQLHQMNIDWAKRRVPQSVWQEFSGPGWRLDFTEMMDAVYHEE